MPFSVLSASSVFSVARLFLVSAGLLLSVPAMAQAPNPAADLARDAQIDLPAPLRGQIETIGRYAAEVNRRAGAPPTRPPRQLELTADPFEVSPQLREGRGARFTGLPGASVLELQRRVRVRAVLRTRAPDGEALAQLLINDKDLITIMDKELIDLGDLGTFQAEIKADAVSLSNPSNPQGKKVVLR
ncbi:MAG: hypothetical protein LBI87_12540 [Candidatus Accumulibacter sp.]|nr:hypothetical protein [Accumulibacter sp.]